MALALYAVGWWSFETIEGGKVLDGSSYGNNGTVTGATIVPGLEQLGNALSFDGNDFVDAGNGSSLRITAMPMTMEAWIKTNTIGATAYPVGIIAKGALGRNGYGMGRNGDNINLGYHGSGNFDSKTAIKAGVWYHIVGIINGASSKIYINGQLDSATSNVGISVTTENLLIGLASTYYFNGLIDEVRIYERGLSAAEIQKHYAEGLVRHQDLVKK